MPGLLKEAQQVAAYLMVKHTVADYDKWKPFFDQDAERRKQHGSKGALVLRDAQKPNDVTIVMEWDSVENAQKFGQTPELKEIMQKAGVISEPQISMFGSSANTSN